MTSEAQLAVQEIICCSSQVTMVPPGGCFFASLVLSAVVSVVTSYNTIGTYPPGKEENAAPRAENTLRPMDEGEKSGLTCVIHGAAVRLFAGCCPVMGESLLRLSFENPFITNTDMLLISF